MYVPSFHHIRKYKKGCYILCTCVCACAVCGPHKRSIGVLLLFGIVFPLLRLVHRILISGIIIVIVILNVGLLLLLQLLLSSGLNCLVANPIAAIQYYFCQQRAHSRLITGVWIGWLTGSVSSSEGKYWNQAESPLFLRSASARSEEDEDEEEVDGCLTAE